MGVSKHDIQVVRKVISTTITALSLGQVPSGMNRWVVFVKAENLYGGENNLYITGASQETYASTIARASNTAKERIQLQAKERVVLPRDGVIYYDKPLFSIASGNYLNGLTTRGDVSVTFMYYDE